MNTRKIALCGLLTALAMILSYVEAILPLSFTVPGVKMGLPNMSELTEEQIKAALKIAVEKAALCTQYYGSKGWIKE